MGSTNDEELSNVKGEVQEIRDAILEIHAHARAAVDALNECIYSGPTPQRLGKLTESARHIRQIGEMADRGVQVAASLPSPLDASRRAERNAALPEPLRGIVNQIGGAPMFRDNETKGAA